jgi:diacylglycerol O-acyltransferase / wax synthase
MTMLERLSPLDASFLEVESTTAHMHVGWAASFSPPEEGPRPSFEALREHIERRLYRAPRYRQRLLRVPFGVNDPVWTDDDCFDIRRHVIRAETPDFGEAVDTVMSAPLDRRRPLWEIWIADELADGRIGVVGKAHHCMVDGLAAVELASLLLDPEPDAPQPPPETWRPAPRPSSASLLARSLRERIGRELDLVGVPLRVARSPAHLLGFATQAMRATRALARSVAPAPTSRLNEPISPLRHLATCRRPLADLQRVKRHFGTTVNDVVLAAAAGAVRRLLEEHGDAPLQLKAMVPVSVRGKGQALGNEISFMFVNLPCDEPDPVRRLRDVHLATMERKEAGEPDGANTVLNALRYAPQTLQRIASHAVAGPRAFNLTVSNIPGPREPLYMLGCELEESYPVVPISDRHAMSIGVTTIKGEACFGVYADRRTLPDADLVAEALDAAVGELLALAEARAGRPVVVTLN